MSDTYSIVLWCADAYRFSSMVASHLLSEGILTTNRGRIDDEIPIVVGVANARRWPIFSREVAVRGVIRGRTPRVTTAERHDYLLTVGSGTVVDSANAPRVDLPVIDAAALVDALEGVSPSALSKREVLGLLNSVAKPASASTTGAGSVMNVRDIADVCQRLVSALAR